MVIVFNFFKINFNVFNFTQWVDIHTVNVFHVDFETNKSPLT